LVRKSIMKYIAYLSLIAAIIFAAACRKEGVKAGPTQLQGNWTLVQTLLDPGDGSGRWQPAAPSTKLGLNGDGTVSGTTFPQYASYTIKDSVTLTFSQSDKSIQNYRYHISHDTLSMSPDGPARCIEACGIRFKKDK
jgi:hypothetical protein